MNSMVAVTLEANESQPLEGGAGVLFGNDRAGGARDYFVAAAPGRELLWIFREHQRPHAWFVHGVFA